VVAIEGEGVFHALRGVSKRIIAALR
jgi:hypothetical protein